MRKSIPVLALLAFVAAAYAQQTYSYRCFKCNGIYTYSQIGSYKCPNDGNQLVLQQK